MLFVLTGSVQTGKTRWLEDLVRNLECENIATYGVIAPGVWADRRDDPSCGGQVDANGFEKLGIENVLMPGGERIAFARRADLAARERAFDPCSQSARASLSWHIRDEAIAQVNGHFSRLSANAGRRGPGLLVVDELGRLELERGGGLTQAVAVLEAGPAPAWQHALVVVRDSLLHLVEGRFARWGETRAIASEDEALEAVRHAFALPR